MKTIKELAGIGAKAAALLNKGCCTIAITKNHPGWYHDEEQRQAFAAAVRDAVEKPLRDEITVMGAKMEELESDLDDLEASRNEWMGKWKTNQLLLEKLVDKVSAEPTPPVTKTKTIPLTMDDIRSTDEFKFRRCSEVQQIMAVLFADETEVIIRMHTLSVNLTYKDLADHYLRRQHGSDEWKPCTKEITLP